MMRRLLLLALMASLTAGCGCHERSIRGEADADVTTEPDVDLAAEPLSDPIAEPVIDVIDEDLIDVEEESDPTWDPASDCTMYDDVVVDTSNWILTIGGADYEFPTHVTVGHDGRILVSSTLNSLSDQLTFMLLEIDGTGNVLEQTLIEDAIGALPDVFGRTRHSVLPLGDCGMLLAGSTPEGPLGELDVWLAKLDWSGTLLWQKSLGGEGHDFSPAVIETRDGGLLVAAMTESWARSYDTDLWLVKLSPDANIVWQQCLGGFWDEHITTADSLVEAPDGTIYVATHTRSFSTGPDLHGPDTWLVSLDSSGNILWQKTLGTHDDDDARWVSDLLFEDGLLLLAGADGTDALSCDAAWVVKMRPSGSIVWEKSYGAGMCTGASSIIPRGDGGYIVSGRLNNVSSTGYNYELWLASLDSDGMIDWQRYVGSEYYEMSGMLVRHEDGLVIVGDHTTSHGGPSPTDVMVARLGLDGAMPGTCPLVKDGAVTAADVVTPLTVTDIVPRTTDGSIRDSDLSFVDVDIPVTMHCPE